MKQLTATAQKNRDEGNDVWRDTYEKAPLNGGSLKHRPQTSLLVQDDPAEKDFNRRSRTPYGGPYRSLHSKAPRNAKLRTEGQLAEEHDTQCSIEANPRDM